MLFDAIISKTEEEGDFLLDVDNAVSKLVKKHLSLYKVRRKIAIKVLEDFNVHAVFPNLQQQKVRTGSGSSTRTFPCVAGIDIHNSYISSNILWTNKLELDIFSYLWS